MPHITTSTDKWSDRGRSLLSFHFVMTEVDRPGLPVP
jgi:hypothetical protein